MLLVLAAALPLALGACSTNRPEGVVEHWLAALNEGSAGDPGAYAPSGLSARILPTPRSPGDLDRIEVGKGADGATTARVPFLVERTSGARIDGVAVLSRPVGGSWRITALAPSAPGLRVPSEGGARIGAANAATWTLSLVAAGALTVVSLGAMALAGRGPSFKRQGSFGTR